MFVAKAAHHLDLHDFADPRGAPEEQDPAQQEVNDVIFEETAAEVYPAAPSHLNRAQRRNSTMCKPDRQSSDELVQGAIRCARP